MFALLSILRYLVRYGTVRVLDCEGKTHIVSGLPGPTVTLRFHDRLTPWKLAFFPSMGLGEGYMDGRITIEDGFVYDFIELIGQNVQRHGWHGVHVVLENLGKLFRRIQQFNPASRAKRNVSHHYDLSGELYKLFLDPDLQYSCAYFETLESDLATAQDHKKWHLAAKLLAGSGQRVLEVGSGWGGLGLYLAKVADAHVTGITLSEEQLKVSNQRAKNEGLAQQVEFHLRDYRDQKGEFDRIVSVGMFEHVGIGHFSQYFAQFNSLLADDGIALLHTIGRSGPPTATDSWIRKYIFPGGYVPALSEVMPKIEKTGLIVTDIECLGLHYAETLRHWQIRFQANRDKIKEIYDERFCRMWEFYLAGSEAAFRYYGLTVFQIQMTKKPGIVPLTRNYIGDAEKSLGQPTLGKNREAA